MSTNTKRIGLALAPIIALAVAAVLLWKNEPPPQIITLPNGQQFQFAGTSYGTRHVEPTLAAQVLSRLPTSLTISLQRVFGPRIGPVTPLTTPERSLCVWFIPVQTNTPGPPGSGVYYSRLADDQDVVAGDWRMVSFAGGIRPAVPALFQVAPRRSRELQFVLFDRQQLNGVHSELGRVRFPNPLFRRYPQWEPEALPSVKRVSDVEARLEGLTTGLPRSAGGFASTRFDVSLKSSRGNSERWAVHFAELSDATGNHIRSAPGYSVVEDSIQGTLWPSEPSWRLKLQLKRNHGFPTEDLVTFRNVPLLKTGATNTVRMTNTLGPFQVVLEEYMLEDSLLPMKPGVPKFRIEITGAPNGLAIDVVRAATDTGQYVAMSKAMAIRRVAGRVSVEPVVYPDFVSTNVTSVDITWAVQKTRTVEFLVKPPKAK